MNDITITPRRIIRELITFLVCFVIGFLVNLVAIVIYKSNFSELFTSLHYVLIFSIVIYLIWSLMRLLFSPIKYLIIPKKKEKKRQSRRIRANVKPMKL
jgi:predicted membrane protein